MKPRTAKSMEIYEIMLQRGYPAEFYEQIMFNRNTVLIVNGSPRVNVAAHAAIGRKNNQI